MADISQITLPSGNTYNIKDAQARTDIASIQTAISGGVTFIGETTTALTDGATTNPITINGSSVTAVKGDLVVYSSKEFVFDATKWIEMGDLSLIGDLGWKDSASGTYTPAGTVSQPTFTGSSSTVTITAADNTSGNYQPKGTVSQPTFTGNTNTFTGAFTPSGSVALHQTGSNSGIYLLVDNEDSARASQDTSSYRPSGVVTTPTISVKTAGATTTVNSITAVGTLPSLTTTVSNEVLTIGWSAGTLPTKGSNTTVKTGDAEYQSSQPTFTGHQRWFYTKNVWGQFTGAEGTVSVSGTPSGTVSQPTFTGTKAQLSGTVTPSGSVSQPTFTGTQATITVT